MSYECNKSEELSVCLVPWKGHILEISRESKNKISYQGLCIINYRSFYIRSGSYLSRCPCQSSCVAAADLGSAHLVHLPHRHAIAPLLCCCRNKLFHNSSWLRLFFFSFILYVYREWHFSWWMPSRMWSMSDKDKKVRITHISFVSVNAGTVPCFNRNTWVA